MVSWPFHRPPDRISQCAVQGLDEGQHQFGEASRVIDRGQGGDPDLGLVTLFAIPEGTPPEDNYLCWGQWHNLLLARPGTSAM